MPRTASWLYITLFLIAGFAFTSCRTHYSEHIDTVAAPIKAVVKEIRIAHPYYQQKVVHKTQAFYEANKLSKNWLEKKHPNPKFKAFIDEVKESYRYGMNPADYAISELETQMEKLYKKRKRSEAEMSELDIRITASYFLFTTHLLEGRIRNAGARDYIWKRGAPHEDDVALLLVNDSKRELKKELDDLQPKDLQYKKLQKVLDEYLELGEKASAFKKIPEEINIRPGQTSEHIPAIKARLVLTKDLKSRNSGSDSVVYDSALVRAVKQFQIRHGLEQDGVINKALISYLNMPFENMAAVIALNLERLRWQPHLPGKDEYIVVNVPEYVLRIYNNKKETFKMRVVLGSEFNATPIFADTLKYIVFSPTWNVPKSILEEEFLPKLKADPLHYSSEFTFFKNGEEIDPAEEDWNAEKINLAEYQAVQKPGPSNSLGNVKFIMPNNFNIYLHDTPADRLFVKQDRAFSHGCIRLEKPLEFAEYLLGDKKRWNQKSLAKLTQLGEPRQVNLKKNYPVHIVYRTAWVDDQGLVNFRKDIYGHDERQLAQLQKSEALLSYKADE
jgi:L,D-transpeptidase YcbB